MKRIIAFFFWLLLLGGAYLAYDVHRFLSSPGSDAAEDVIITIAPGATFDRVAWDLKKAGAITDVTRFRLLARYKDSLGKVRVGEYMINTGWMPEQVLWQITQGQPILYRLSIREGLTWWETAREVEAQGFARYEDFKEVIHDPDFLREHNIPFANAEGFLYPETYLRNKPRALDKAQAREVAASMVMMFWKKTQPLWAQLPQKKDASAPRAANGTGPDAGTASAPGSANGTARNPVSLAPVAGSMGSSNGSQSQEVSAVGAAPAGADSGAAPRTAANPPATAERQSAPAPERNATGAAPATTTPPAAPASGRPGRPANETAPAADNATRLSAANATGAPAGNAARLPAGNATTPSTQAREQAPSLSPEDLDPEALRRLVILASLVEKETAIPGERARVAGVYANRLRLDMLLQCDPTIIYGVGESFSGSIRKSQLNDAKNRYNTYIHAGLPPGPICSPGLEAIKAAASPERHDFLYFVATGVDGGHSFSKTLNDHNKAVQVYRSRMREGQ